MSTSDTTPVVGYSSNDFFYNNPTYCPKDPNDKNQYLQHTSDSDDTPTPTGLDEIPYAGSGDIDHTNACSANQYYAALLSKTSNQSQTTSAKYTYSLTVYNRELLRTVNYLAGVGLLFIYLYVNRESS